MGMGERNKVKNKIKSGNKVILNVFLVIFLIYSFTLLFPFVWIFYNSFKNMIGFAIDPIGMPDPWHPENYIAIFSKLSEFDLTLQGMFFNSLTLVIGQVTASLFVCSCAAYVVSRYKFRGRSVIYFISILIMFIPTTGSLIIYYKLVQDLGLINTYYGMIIMHAGGFGFQFIVLYGFFKSISWSYAEAAFIDGAGDFRVFFRIMLPMAKSVLVALGILGAIGVWNDYMGQVLFYQGKPTVAVGLQTLSVALAQEKDDYPLYFCVMLICTLPVIVLYASCQKIIVKNTLAGGLKG